MSIVKMKHLHLVGLREDQSGLLHGLRELGCVEIRQPAGLPEEWDFLRPPGEEELDRVSDQAGALRTALDILQKLGPPKSGLLSPRPEVGRDEFFDNAAYAAALEVAAQTDAAQRELHRLQAHKGKLESQRMELSPWLDLAVDLSLTGTRSAAAVFAYVPRSVSRDALGEKCDAATELYHISWAGEDRENRYFLLLCHRSALDDVHAALLAAGGGRANLKGRSGTAKENDLRLQKELEDTEKALNAAQDTLKDCLGHWEDLRRALDRAEQDLSLERARSRLLDNNSTFLLEGWTPAERAGEVETFLKGFTAAYQLSDPTEEEYPQVPIQLKNNRVTASMSPITEMYSMPAYGSVDPNPLMAPFFILFFGFMMNDIAYGLLMVLGTALFLKLARPKEGTRNMMTLFLLCGISSIFWGCLTGSFFGDFFPKLFSITGATPPGCYDASGNFQWFWKPLFNPVSDTILVMIGSMALGAIQVFTGMAISAIEKFRKGSPWDALFDEIAWWVTIGGGVAAILAGTPGLVVLVIGLLMLVVGGTRKEKGLGKITGAVGILYNGISGFFSDILSYLRLMALMMAGSIIAQVFNTLGSVFGLGAFIVVALIGNVLNLVLNLLGCYVHTLRLQCLEFFGRFYQDGGKAFKPLNVDPNFVDITNN